MKNLHIEHLEDGIFEIDGIQNVTAILKNLKKCTVTRKFDGNPAIVCGTNPENKKFFVATKSAFNKTPKVCYSKSDVEKYYSDKPDLAERLSILLKELPSLNAKTILQGDLLYIRKDAVFSGQTRFFVKPNVLGYEFDKSDLRSVGIVFHTSYTGKTLTDLSCKFLRKSPVSKDDIHIPEIKIWNIPNTNYAKLTSSTINKKQLNVLLSNETLVSYIKQYINSLFRTDVYEAPNSAGLELFICTKYSDIILKLKTEAGRLKRLEEKKSLVNCIIDNETLLEKLFHLHYELTKIKLDILEYLNNNNKNNITVYCGNSGVKTEHEGYVVSTSKYAYKLVDRQTFSKLNFEQND